MLRVLLALTPLLLTIAVYAICDPFEVLRNYYRYYTDPNIVYNRDYISTEIFLANYRKEHYDSFIFGNSRSLAFQCGEWRRYIKAKGVFHFDASGESLYGIYKKIIFLDRQGVGLSNCLLVLDEDTIMKIDNHSDHLGIKHPKVSQESVLSFQMEFLRAFMSPRFCYFIGYLDYKVHNKVRPRFSKLFMQSRVQYDSITNDMFLAELEDEIQRTGSQYYENKKGIFYKRERKEKTYTAKCIKTIQKEYFAEIKKIFDKHGTNYRIVINPAYDQCYFNIIDLNYLKNMFGGNYVFDFSGVNEYTNSVFNYYDISHYRPVIGRKILETVYQQNKQ
jgi:hypothetical protein